MPQWTVAYDIGREPAPIGNEIRGGIAGVLVCGLLLALVWKRRERAPKLLVAAFLLAWIGFSVATGASVVREHRAAQGLLARGAVDVVEGKVEDLVPPRPEGGYETFRIGNRTFLVSDGENRRPGLARTSARGGPVRGGARLRISSSDGAILRLEEWK